MKKMVIEFETMDDGYATTQGIAWIDGRFFVLKTGRGEFDVLSKISKHLTDTVIARSLPVGSNGDALESHIQRFNEAQEDSE